MNKVNTLFIGSGKFAVDILDKLLSLDFLNIVSILSQPDKPVGRKAKLTPCPVQAYSLKQKIKTYQPKRLKKESKKILAETNPELIIVADYGQIIPNDVLDYPKYKCLNVHGSILPDLRGAVPIPMAILHGYSETGVSIPIMTPGLDDGGVIGVSTLQIMRDDMTNTLKPKLAKLGGELLENILPKWFAGEIVPIKQDDKKATYCYIKDLAKDKAEFDSSYTVKQVDRMIRAFNPWPVAWCKVKINNKELRLKIFEAKLSDEEVPKGMMMKIGKEMYLGLSDGSLKLVRLQLEGKRQGSL